MSSELDQAHLNLLGMTMANQEANMPRFPKLQSYRQHADAHTSNADLKDDGRVSSRNDASVDHAVAN
ncbi:hypothetical protein ACTXLO_11970 [Psychrobacter alimentarius]|uniref:hypothetical protein n=1 Tax=Psychrobacter alimentarius TaxID=261164 RepID=UPI003FD079FA